MSLSETGFTGRNTTQSTDAMTGLLLQDPESMYQSATGLNSASLPSEQTLEIEQTQFGVPFLMAFTVIGHADSGGDTLTAAVLDPAGTAGAANGPAPWRFRVLRRWVRAGGVASTPEGALTINHLSTASAANAMSESFDLNLDNDDIGYSASGAGQLIDPYDVVATGEGLQLSVVLGANEECDFVIFFECMRVIA